VVSLRGRGGKKGFGACLRCINNNASYKKGVLSKRDHLFLPLFFCLCFFASSLFFFHLFFTEGIKCCKDCQQQHSHGGLPSQDQDHRHHSQQQQQQQRQRQQQHQQQTTEHIPSLLLPPCPCPCPCSWA
jgi:hypothetical protein